MRKLRIGRSKETIGRAKKPAEGREIREESTPSDFVRHPSTRGIGRESIPKGNEGLLRCSATFGRAKKPAEGEGKSFPRSSTTFGRAKKPAEGN